MLTYPSEERRKTERVPVLIDVIVTNVSNGTDSTSAELLDLNLDGAGLVMLNEMEWLKNNVNVRIEFQSEFSSKGPIFGSFREQSPPSRYRPNVRSGGVCIDADGRDCLLEVMDSCRAGEMPPSETSIGFRRAWTRLCTEDRILLKSFWEELVQGGDQKTIAENLMKDVNCGGHRLFNLMRTVVQVLHNNAGMGGSQVLAEAFEAYRVAHSLEDTKKDRLIEYELGSLSLTRV